MKLQKLNNTNFELLGMDLKYELNLLSMPFYIGKIITLSRGVKNE